MMLRLRRNLWGSWRGVPRAVLDLSRSPQYDVTSRRVQERVCRLLQSGRLRSVMLEPPCATFSAAARPACRSYAVPFRVRPLRPEDTLGQCYCLCLLRNLCGCCPQPGACPLGAAETFQNEVASFLALGSRDSRSN